MQIMKTKINTLHSHLPGIRLIMWHRGLLSVDILWTFCLPHESGKESGQRNLNKRFHPMKHIIISLLRVLKEEYVVN